MTLLELLVRELPKRGGWPEGAVECEPFIDEATIDFYDWCGNWPVDCGEKYGAIAVKCIKPRESGDGYRKENVKKEEYEAALAASKQPEWDGEGLPPVGCECEAKMPMPDSLSWCWRRVKVVISGMVKSENECLVYDVETTRPAWVYEFRPIRTEAERKREVTIDALQKAYLRTPHRGAVGEGIWEHISEGKIPGVRLTDDAGK